MWPPSREECYVSIDIEADGPVPGLNSMLSIGAAAFTSDGALARTFSANLKPLPEAHEDETTLRWRESQPAAWEACRAQTQDPEQAQGCLHAWVAHQARTLGLPVMVALPASYDAMWVQSYLHRFVGEDPFRRRAVDIKTRAMMATYATKPMTSLTLVVSTIGNIGLLHQRAAWRFRTPGFPCARCSCAFEPAMVASHRAVAEITPR